LKVNNDNNDDSLGVLDVDDGVGGDGGKFNCILDVIGLVDQDCAAFKQLHKCSVSLARLM
jgi:hypothetical protein